MRPFFTGNLITSAWFFSFVYSQEIYMWHWSNVIRKRPASHLNKKILPDLIYCIGEFLLYAFYRKLTGRGEDEVILIKSDQPWNH